MGFIAADNVSLQLSAANADLSTIVAAANNNTLAANIDFIKASGATLTVSQSQADALANAATGAIKFALTDLVTLKLDGGNSNIALLDNLSNLQVYSLNGVRQIAADGDAITLSMAEAQNVSRAALKFAPNETITVKLSAAGIADLGQSDAAISASATLLKNEGVTQLQSDSGTISLSVAQVKDITGIGTGLTPTNLKFISSDTVIVTAQATTSADIDYLASNTSSLKASGVDQIAAADGSAHIAFSVSQLALLLNAGANGLVIDPSNVGVLTVNNASDLAYLLSNALAVDQYRVTSVNLANAVQNLTLAQAEALDLAGLTVANAVVNLSTADLAALAAGDATAATLKAHGFTSFNLGGATISDTQATCKKF